METSYGFGIRVRNVNHALQHGLTLIRHEAQPTSSRGLEVLRAPGPVTTVYDNPQERVLFDETRDANPFFHLIDALWVLSGSNRVDLPARFLSNITRFSDNGIQFHGAYGHRLRHAFGFDQIEMAITLLKEKPDTRQVVLSIWHPTMDLAIKTADMPCNDMVMLDITEGRLNITVCNRSNDVIWGAYGANAVQFSMLQEYMAVSVGVGVGRYVQQSNNYHVYTDNTYWLKWQKGDMPHIIDPYEAGKVVTLPLATDELDARALFHDCCTLARVAEDGDFTNKMSFGSSFFKKVVVPAIQGYDLYKTKDFHDTLRKLEQIEALDWQVAMTEWVQRRAAKAEA